MVAANTAVLAQKVGFPFSLICNPEVPYPVAGPGAMKATAMSAVGGSGSTQLQLTSTMSCMKPGWVLVSNPYFIERYCFLFSVFISTNFFKAALCCFVCGDRAINKYARRRRSVDYRTDLPLFRPSIADMVADARNRLLKFKEAHLQSHGRMLTAANLAGMLLTDRQLKGVGQCVVDGSSIDPAIDAYTQFLHRYALHVSSIFLIVFISLV
jgi:hypothetical protein